MEMSDQLHDPADLPLEMNPCTHSIGVWVGPKSQSERFRRRKNLTSISGFNTLLHKNVITASSWLPFVSLDKQDLKCIKRNAIMVTHNLSSILGKLYHLGDLRACNTTTYHDWKYREACFLFLHVTERATNNRVKWRARCKASKRGPRNYISWSLWEGETR